MKKYHILLCIYNYLDEHFDKSRGENFIRYMRGLNPYLWGDGSTAEPEYFEDFMKIVNGYFQGNECSVEDGLKYAGMYLRDYNKLERDNFSSNIDEAEELFKKCTVDDWKRCCEKIPNSLKSVD